MAENPASQIYMTHPTLPGVKPRRTTRKALDTIWADKGWVEHKPTTDKPTPTPSPVPAKGADQQASTTPATGKKGS